MIIQGLKLVLEESDVASRLRDGLGAVDQLKDMTFGLVPGAVKIGGRFQAGIAIPFETQWSVEVLDAGRKLGVKLAGVSVGFFGMNAAALSAQVMSALGKKLKDTSGVVVAGDTIVLDPGLLLAPRGVRLEAPIRRVEVLLGRVEIEV